MSPSSPSGHEKVDPVHKETEESAAEHCNLVFLWPRSSFPLQGTMGALIIRKGFWADYGQKSEASTAKDVLCIPQMSSYTLS